MDKTNSISAGDVVQINPLTQAEGFFAGCFLTVTDIYSWGVQGYVLVPDGPRGALPGRAFFRANWADIEPIGRAIWMQQ